MKKHLISRHKKQTQLAYGIFALIAFLVIGALSIYLGGAAATGIAIAGFKLQHIANVPLAPLTKEQIEAVTAASREALLNEFGGLVEGKEAIKKLTALMKQLEEKKTVDEVLAMKPEFESFKTSLTSLKAQLEAAGKGNGKMKTHKSLQSAWMKGLKNLYLKKEFEKLKSNSAYGLTVKLGKYDETGAKILGYDTKEGKLVDNPMSDGTSVVPIGSGIPNVLTQMEPGLTRATRRKPFIAQLVDLAQTLERYISWMEQTNIDTGIAFTIVEGASASGDYGSFRWTQNSQQAQEITALSKMTKVMLDDLQNAQQEVQTEIMELLALKLDSQILTGNGTAPNLKGITQFAQGFVNTGLAIQAPNNYDCLIAAALQIMVNGTKSGIAAGGEIINIFEPTDICLNPVDYYQMMLTKDTLNRYVKEYYPDLEGADRINGMRITANIGITQGSFLVMDAAKSHVRIRLDSSLTLGYVGNDFADGLVTIKGDLRAVHYIKGIEQNAFVYDTFANTKALIQSL